jgi:hypothetical protein
VREVEEVGVDLRKRGVREVVSGLEGNVIGKKREREQVREKKRRTSRVRRIS